MIEAQRQEVTNQKNIAIKTAEAEQAKIEAEAKAERIKINAEAEAEAIKVKAAAEAEANKKLAESLSDKVLALKEIEAWEAGGSLVPQVQGSSTPILNIGGNK